MRAGLGTCAAPLLALLVIATASPVLAQVNLPPPPPPPLNGGSSGTSSGTSAGTSGSTSSGSSDNTSPSGTHKPKPHKPPEPAHTMAPPPPQPPPREVRHDPPPQYDSETPRTTSIRLNPLPIFAGRLSADLEFMLAPHHALVVSPNVTFHKLGFGRNDNILGYGLGYAFDNSAGFGTEVGYHYWLRRHLAGIYLGPSLILGATLPQGGKSFGYYGGAFDVGYQYLFPNGFTLNGGGGILIINATPTGSTVHGAPRFLFGVGWSF